MTFIIVYNNTAILTTSVRWRCSSYMKEKSDEMGLISLPSRSDVHRFGSTKFGTTNGSHSPRLVGNDPRLGLYRARGCFIHLHGSRIHPLSAELTLSSGEQGQANLRLPLSRKYEAFRF